MKDVLKSVIIPLWNSYGFFVTYANIDKFPESLRRGATSSRDRGAQSPGPLDALALRGPGPEGRPRPSRPTTCQGAIAPIVDFIDSLNNWYIRRNRRRRFWRSGGDEDKAEAYSRPAPRARGAS